MDASTAIQVEQLGKKYRVGHLEPKALSAGGRLRQVLLRPFRYLRSRFESDSEVNTIWALKDVSFEVKAGEVFGIIGRNGAGKSTLLKILSRITDPTDGEAALHGHVNALLEVGTGFHPELTGRENIYMSAALHGMRKADIDEKLEDIVAFAGVKKFIDTPVKRYSSGMAVRLGFAVAASLDPDILIVDEVLAVGDHEFQSKCLGRMEEAAGGGRTVLFVSHNMEMIEKLCDRVMVLKDGQVAFVGHPREAVEHYLRREMGLVGRRVWEPALRPGNEVARLCRVEAATEEGEPGLEFSVRSPMRIAVEFEAGAGNCEITVVFFLYDEQGHLIFVTLDSQSERWRGKPRPRGKHVSICHIPANLLNEGSVRLDVGLVTHPYEVHALEHDTLAIRLVDSHEPGGARGGMTREWPGGAVRPLFDWSFKEPT